MKDDRKTVCVIGPLPPPMTGLSKALDTIVRSEAMKQEYDFRVIDLGSLYTVSGGRFSAGKLSGFFRLQRALKDVLRTGGAEIYYLTIAQSAVGAVRDCMLLRLIRRDRKRKAVVIHLHGGGFRSFYQNAPKPLQLLIRSRYRTVTRAAVLGDSLRNMFEGILPEDRIRIVPNCVDNAFLLTEEEIRSKLDRLPEKETLQVLYLSNMIREKGYPDVLEAAKLCRAAGKQLRFVFAGKFYSEEEEAEFRRQLSAEGGLAEYIGTVGGADKRQLLQESDLFVLPTYYPHEGQPITIIEAMSAGMPVICTDHAGIGDLVKDGVNGITVEKNAPEQIAGALKALDGDRERMRRIAEANRAEVLAHYTEAAYLNNIRELLR